MPRLRLATVVALLGMVTWCGRAHALEADELLLLVNKNVPDGQKLAERYAKARNVPAGRIVELSLPMGDEITFDQYERDVVPPVRRFLKENKLESKVKCLVTFYGVPLRIARRPVDAEERKEVTELQSMIAKLRGEIEPMVVQLEKLAQKLDPSFEVRMTGGGSEDAVRRADRAAAAIQKRVAELTDPSARNEAHNALMKVMERLVGPNMVTVYLAGRELSNPALPQADRERWEKLVDFVRQSRTQLVDLVATRYDAAARAKARDVAEKGFGLLEYAGIVQGQLEYLKPGDTAASLDNELSLLWWNLYPRAAWMGNPLKWDAPKIPHEPVLMVSRMDAPDVATVNRMLADALRAEQDGLSGRVVVDSRGIAGKGNGYAQFDQHLVNFANLVKAKSKMELTLDVKGEVLPPNSADNVALYVGWYSVGHYVPACKLVPGAVAYHVASFEMTSLHSVGGAWVPHLLQDGACASLGPVAEPYLHAFPAPEEFFPLLMTGKVTLAEAYWRTEPTTSWMIGLVGDPLYNPFAKAPALKVEDLPAGLQAATRETALSPTSRP